MLKKREQEQSTFYKTGKAKKKTFMLRKTREKFAKKIIKKFKKKSYVKRKKKRKESKLLKKIIKKSLQIVNSRSSASMQDLQLIIISYNFVK